MQAKYCTYLTIYTGNKMPPFYIGRSNLVSIAKGYRGSVSSKRYKEIWLSELSEHPELFKIKILSVHATAKEAASKEEFFHKKFQVHRNPLYINQATGAGTFYADIAGKKNPFYGISRIGELNPMYGRKHSAESLGKMSKNNKGKHSQPKTEEFKKKMQALYAGKTYEERFGANYAAEIKAKMSGKIRSEQHKQNIRDNPYHANRPKLSCPHCKTECSVSNLKRWHGDNCKSLKIFTDKC
jgi:NUMOD3 motif